MNLNSITEPQDAMIPGQEQPQSDATENQPDFEADLTGGTSSDQRNRRGMYILAGLVLIGAFAVWFIYFRGAPQQAMAVAPSDASAQIQKFLDSGNINLMKQTLKDSEKIVQQFRTYPAKTQVPLASLRSNPFRELEQSPVAAPTNRDQESEVEFHKKVLGAVAELHLQSIIHGSHYRGCMINNTLYQEGQQVGIFTVEQIAAATVIVRADKYRFELKMQN